ncbi:uncharacterized protein CBL_01853 [Carabus blaptoides fortunei]
MLKFQLLQVQDVKEAAAIERRRRYEEERKKRIFNARSRIIGVDYDSLSKQIQEKHQKEEQEKKLEELYAEQRIRDAEFAMSLERKEREERKRINQEINEFRQVYQKAQDRREFDLYDPEAFKKSLPTRLDDDDPRCGISSAQKFEGEDLASNARKKIQVEQTKAWLEQQLKEQEAAEKELHSAENAYQAAVVARDARAIELAKLEKECKKRLEQATNRFNEALLQQQKIDKDIKKRQELEDNFAEMYNAVTGDLLTENPGMAQSNFGPNRQIAYMYKGMSSEERNAIRRDQLKQIEENKQKREEEERLRKYWDDYAQQTGSTVSQMNQELEKKYKELSKQLAEHNRTLAKEQKAYTDYLDRVVYSNKPTTAYFEQFNTTSR